MDLDKDELKFTRKIFYDEEDKISLKEKLNEYKGLIIALSLELILWICWTLYLYFDFVFDVGG